MKTELKAKLLQHLLIKKKGEEGFTLIELLVAIVIIGVLAAIALPSFLNQANRAREAEAAAYIGSLNRGQQAYYLQNQAFAPDLNTLAVGILEETINYRYATTKNTESTLATSTATAIKPDLVNFAGGVKVVEGNTLAKVCREADACDPTAAVTP